MATVKPNSIGARQMGELSRLLEERGVGSTEIQFLIENPDMVAGIIKKHGMTEGWVITSDNWLDLLCEKERQAHFAFFHKEFDLTFFQQVLEKYGFEQIKKWRDLLLEPHFLPSVVLTEETNFPGWKVQPEDWFWKKIGEGKLLRRDQQGNLVQISEVNLGGIVVLVDARLKPKYKDGKQMWSNDKPLLGKILADLRESRKIAKYEYGSQGSRFGVSAKEIDNFVISEYAKTIRFEPSQIRLERVIEGNIISQLYTEMPRKNDGKTSSSVWYDEHFEDAGSRLDGGHSDNGGLARVNYSNVDRRWDDGSFRLLGVLGP